PLPARQPPPPPLFPYTTLFRSTLAERIRAGDAGIGGLFTRTGYGTVLAEGKETRVIDGQGYVLEQPLTAGVALIKADSADRAGKDRKSTRLNSSHVKI